MSPLIGQPHIPNVHHGVGDQDQQPRGGSDSGELYIHLPTLTWDMQSLLNNRGIV